MLERSDCDSLREGGCRCSGAVLHRAVQQVVDHRICSFVVQGGIRHTASEEGRLGSCRCKFVPANLQSLGDVEAVGASIVAKQLVGYLTASGLLPRLQSAYRAHHSTETAVLKVMTDILRAFDTGNLAVLTLLDLSAAFDTVDHATLLRRLSVTYGLDSAVMSWFLYYLSGRTQFVRCGSSKSASSTLSCGVPQSSVLGPILFLLYTADLLGLIEQHDLIPHLYADDTQICGNSPPSNVLQLQERVSGCVDDVAKWMQSNRLQLNTAKTEVR